MFLAQITKVDHLPPAAAMGSLVARVEEIGAPLVVCRSKSGGAHCFAFFFEPIPAGLVIDKLVAIAASLGHPGVEIFPKQRERASPNEVGSWINLPYYGGEYTTRFALWRGEALDLDEFLDLAESKMEQGTATMEQST